MADLTAACRFTVIFKDEDVFEAGVFFEFAHSCYEHVRKLFYLLYVFNERPCIVPGGRDYYFMGANTVHQVIHTLAAAVKLAFGP